MNTSKILGLIVVILLVIFGINFLFNKKNEGAVACTLEAKLCPDGSYVGRTGPKCEFSPCPTIPVHSNWKTFEGDGYSFQYPEEFPTTYISKVDWPPLVNFEDSAYSCLNAGSEIEGAGRTEERVINGHSYCITTKTQGAAGSIYNQYAYAKAFNDRTVIFTFTSREPQCVNYDDPKKTECQNERDSFSVDKFIDEIISTLQIK